MDLYNRPADEFVATFLGSPKINLIARPAVNDASAAHQTLWNLLAAQAPASVLRVGIRPEHLRVASPDQGVAATVVLAEHLGDTSILHLRVQGVEELLNVKVATTNSEAAAGQDVGLVPDPSRALMFAADGRRVD